MLFIDNDKLNLMDRSDELFMPEDYVFNFSYSKKMYPLLGVNNITLILIIKEMIEFHNPKKELENIKMTLLISNLKLINWTIRTYYPDNNLDKEELQMIGLEGLYDAIEKFNYNYVEGFSKFAIIAIRNKIRHNFRQVSEVPIYAYFERNELLSKIELLNQKYGRQITLEELAKEENMDLKTVVKILSKKFEKTSYIEDNYTNINDEVYTILRMQNRLDIIELILSAIPEKKRDIYLNVINYYPNSLSREELCIKYNLSIQTICLHYYEVNCLIKKYIENKDKYITGNNKLYKILLELLSIYKIQYSDEEYNNIIRKYYRNYENIDLVTIVAKKLIDICNKHKGRDIDFITYELFKKYDMLLDYSFVEKFFSEYLEIYRKYREKIRIKRKK